MRQLVLQQCSPFRKESVDMRRCSLPRYACTRLQTAEASIACTQQASLQSTRSLDGLARTLPCEPPPLAQTCASGLSRTQQLLALQALWFPCVPSYDADMGGLVRLICLVGNTNKNAIFQKETWFR